VPHSQHLKLVEAVDVLGVDRPAFPPEHDRNAAVAVAHAGFSDLADTFAQSSLLGAARAVVVGRAWGRYRPAGPANRTRKTVRTKSTISRPQAGVVVLSA
jgi:hypothetical protein